MLKITQLEYESKSFFHSFKKYSLNVYGAGPLLGTGEQWRTRRHCPHPDGFITFWSGKIDITKINR